MLDLGVYPTSFAHDFLGVPTTITALGQLTPDDVDGQVSMILDYPGNAQATLHTTMWSKTPTTAAICGTEGRITLDGPFYAPGGFEVLTYADGEVQVYEKDDVAGLAFEAAEVARCVAAGLTESPRMTWLDTLEVMVTMDEIRAQVGVVYEGE